MKNIVLWNMMAYNLVESYQGFRRAGCFYVHDRPCRGPWNFGNYLPDYMASSRGDLYSHHRENLVRPHTGMRQDM
jgi:hypothetical protein